MNIATGVLAAVAGLIIARMYVTFAWRPSKSADVPTRGDPAESVVFYSTPGFGGLTRNVSSSPFCSKLDAYLRIAKITHTRKTANFQKAPKGKIPYIVHGGTCMGDSTFVIKYLNNTFSVGGRLPGDLVAPANAAEAGTAIAIQRMCEEHLYWGTVRFRWNSDSAAWEACKRLFFGSIPPVIRSLVSRFARNNVAGYLHAVGLGRHSVKDCDQLCMEDVDALSALLGDREFFGGTGPGVVDCVVFGGACEARAARVQGPVHIVTHFSRCAALEAPMNAAPAVAAWPVAVHMRSKPNLVRFVDNILHRYFRDGADGFQPKA